MAEGELDLLTNSATLPYDQPPSIREIFQRLRKTYCRLIGAQFMHIDNVPARQCIMHQEEGSKRVGAAVLRLLQADSLVASPLLKDPFAGHECPCGVTASELANVRHVETGQVE